MIKMILISLAVFVVVFTNGVILAQSDQVSEKKYMYSGQMLTENQAIKVLESAFNDDNGIDAEVYKLAIRASHLVQSNVHMIDRLVSDVKSREGELKDLALMALIASDTSHALNKVYFELLQDESISIRLLSSQALLDSNLIQISDPQFKVIVHTILDAMSGINPSIDMTSKQLDMLRAGDELLRKQYQKFANSYIDANPLNEATSLEEFVNLYGDYQHELSNWWAANLTD